LENTKLAMPSEKDIEGIFSTFEQLNPHPKTELEYTNDFTLLVAIVLSAQATDVGVNKATKKLFEIYDTPQKMLDLGIDGLKEYIKTIGLFNSKAKNIIELSKSLVAQNNIIPDTLEELIKLPGVGRKTANVYLNAVHNLHTIAVDTHVARVANRLGFTSQILPEKVEKDLLNTIPMKWLKHAHNWLVLHGRYICKARKPLCEQCPIKVFCSYYKASQNKS
jgi:endonuclease III